MTNKVRAKQAAISEIESIFTEAGWSDAWGLTDEQIKNAPSPLFYRTATPRAAADAKVIVDGVGRNIYAIYHIVAPETDYASNQPHHFNITVAITIYYDDAYTFAEGSHFAKYLEGLYSNLAERLWTLSGGNEEATGETSDRSPYAFREIIFTTNTF